MRILLDTNIVLRSVEPRHTHHQASVDAIDILRQSGHELVIVPQVLYEFWAVATRPIDQNGLGMTTVEAHSEITTIRQLFLLLRDERAVYAIWENLVWSHGVVRKQAHDARLAAAMQRHGLAHLLTFNKSDFARFAIVVALSPLDVAIGANLPPL